MGQGAVQRVAFSCGVTLREPGARKKRNEGVLASFLFVVGPAWIEHATSTVSR